MIEIYVLEATIGCWEDKHTYAICYFDDPVRAEIACNGFNDVVAELEEVDYATYLNNAYDHIYGDYLSPTEEQHQAVREIDALVKLDAVEYPTYSITKIERYDN